MNTICKKLIAMASGLMLMTSMPGVTALASDVPIRENVAAETFDESKTISSNTDTQGTEEAVGAEAVQTSDEKEALMMDASAAKETATAPERTADPEETAAPKAAADTEETAAPKTAADTEETAAPKADTEETAAPGADMDPEETAAPGADMDPEETAAPGADADPEETAGPEAPAANQERATAPEAAANPEETADPKAPSDPTGASMTEKKAGEAAAPAPDEQTEMLDKVEVLDTKESLAKENAANPAQAEDTSYEEEDVEMTPLKTVVGAYTVGDDVTADFNKSSGAVVLYSNKGTLWRDWISKAGFKGIVSVTVADSSGTVYLPADSSSMFSKCENLTSLDLHKLNTSKVTNMSKMFWGCSSLTTLDLSSFNTAKVTDMADMFAYCYSLKTLDLTNVVTKNVENMSGMFSRCKSLASLDLSGFNTASVTNMANMFLGCESLTHLDLKSFNTTNVTNLSGFFKGCASLANPDLTNFNTANVTDMSSMFSDCGGLTKLDLSFLDTSNVTNMANMFYKCRGLTNLDVSKMNTANVTSMLYMFCDCTSLVNLDLSTFDTSNVTSMDLMFGWCTNLTRLNVSSFNTAKVTDMHRLFEGCQNLTELDLSSFDTASVTNMRYMFYSCSSLTNLELSHFKTENVKDMTYMFQNCSSLSTLDIRNFDMSAAHTHMDGILQGCTGLTVLMTPRINENPEDLPVLMYDSSGKKYSSLPIVKKSVVLAITKDLALQTEKTDISNASVSGVKTSYVYTGKALTPEPTVKISGKTLKKNTHYTVKYVDNVTPGMASISITGKGAYFGHVKKTFLILPKAAKISSVKNKNTGLVVAWGKCNYANGYYIYRDGKNIAAVGSNTLEYIDGTAKNGKLYVYHIRPFVTVNGSRKRGDYNNQVKCVRLTTPTISSAKNSESQKIKVTWKKNSKATGYQVRYVLGSTKKTYTIKSAATVSQVLSGLKKGKTYQIYMRAYSTVDGKNYYSAWCAIKKVTVKK